MIIQNKLRKLCTVIIKRTSKKLTELEIKKVRKITADAKKLIENNINSISDLNVQKKE